MIEELLYLLLVIGAEFVVNYYSVVFSLGTLANFRGIM